MENIGFTKIPFKFNGGINLDFVEQESMNLTDNFICSICLGVVLDPILCEANECIFCKECIESWLIKQKECPNCKKTFEKNPGLSRLLKNIIFKIKMKCVFLSNGCPTSIDYQNYVNHVENCEYSSFKCNNSGCIYTGIKTELISHVESCEFKKSQCKVCKEELSNEDIKKHLEFCKYMCPICKALVEPTNVAIHNNGNCYETLVNFYTKHCELKENNASNMKNIVSKFNNLSISQITPQKYNQINSDSNTNRTNNILSNSTVVNNTNPLNSVPLNLKCHTILNTTTFTVLNPETIKTTCCICRVKSNCRFQCNTCRLYICYSCYYSKSKNYCPSVVSHVLTVYSTQHLNYCDKCQLTKMIRVYKDTVCNIQICESCTKKY